MSTVLSEAKRLHGLGFAIIWIHPKSKRPVASGWTTGPRTPWAEMVSTYREGMNVGVRTGTPSKIGDHYLACIDLDIKKPECKADALKALAILTKGRKFPEVRSGSGGGSRHLYCVTAEPFKMITVEKHEGWEICVYSDGRQMVLPPSTHPSGRLYTWKVPLDGEIPLIEFARPDKVVKPAKTPYTGKPLVNFEFTIEEVPLECVDISKKVFREIRHGDGILERSDQLPRISDALFSAGLSANEILNVLTDSKNFIAGAALERKGGNRTAAAQWIHQYTLQEIIEKRSFPPVGGAPEKKLTAEEIEKQTAELLLEIKVDTGFYYRGPRGGLLPDYGLLLKEFEGEQPFKTIADMKAVYTFNGTHYIYCTPIEIKAFAENKFDPKPEEKIRAEFNYKVLANNVHLRRFFTESTEGKINFKNGVLDLNKSDTDLLDHTPALGFRGVLPYDFDPFASCPVFREWMNGIMLGDKELIAILQEFMGYVIRGGDYKYHKALWLGGVGRNGKSTFVDLLKALIGAGNFSVLSIKSLVGDKFASSDLDGKIANFSEETSPQELRDSGPFKNLTGDGDMLAQKKYGDIYTFRNRAKLIMTYNTIPDLSDLSPGMLSRPLIIPFEKIIEEGDQDRAIKSKLFAELSGIFNYALDGWHRLEKQEGFTKSKKSGLALEKIKTESCNVYQWVENHIEFKDGDSKFGSEGTFRCQVLYSAYVKSEKFTFRAPEFYRRLNTHPKVKERHIEGRDFNYYWGMRVQ